MQKKQIHFIGIGGTAMASLARAFSIVGFKVTGSDVSHIFPPMSNYLKKNKIKYYTPFNPEKLAKIITKKGEIVIGNAHVSDENPEVKYLRGLGIQIKHFPKLLEKYFIKKNSVVIAGTYAKTTITAMTAWVFEKCNKNPNYMLGGIPLNFNHGARLTKSNLSIAEGDEYPAASPWDYSSKFDFYHPKYLILTSAEWDHFDIFKTKKDYINTFINLVKNMPRKGLIVAKLGGENLDEVLKYAKCKVIYYCIEKRKKKIESEINNKIFLYYIDNIKYQNNITKFSIFKNKNLIGEFETSLMGDFNLENWCAIIALANELKLPLKKIQQAVMTFKGVRRRLEIRSKKNNIIIIDDFAHSPSKAKGAVQALVKYFPNSRIFVIFEPNRGGRALKCMRSYKKVFSGIYKVFIPKLTEYKQKPGVYDVSGKELTEHLKKSHKNIIYHPDNSKILNSILSSAKQGDVVVFMGSRDFDSSIKQLLKKFNKIKYKYE